MLDGLCGSEQTSVKGRHTQLHKPHFKDRPKAGVGTRYNGRRCIWRFSQ
jgi:hypothetical protein